MPTEEDIAHLRLIRTPRIGPKNFRKLINTYGTATKALEYVPKMAADAGVKGFTLADEKAVLAEFSHGRKIGAKPYFLGRSEYPSALGIAPDAPPFFWALGRTELLKTRIVGMVGARNASSLGTRFARSLAQALGEAGLTVASGLARGIDAAAHQAALETGTIAVQAGGLSTVYPPGSETLHHEIGISGLRLSEHNLGLQPQARHFPRRNYVLAGLCEALIVVEGASGSGSLITARAALDLGREVMAVPGHPFDARASGCNALLKDGAVLIRNADDVLEALSPERQDAITAAEPTADPADRKREKTRPILSLIGPTPSPEDAIIRDSGLSVSDAARQIAELELAGQITRDAGGRIARSA
ncbi:MAG: DNA-processing protein DprA [Pseudomonadota bacterium]